MRWPSAWRPPHARPRSASEGSRYTTPRSPRARRAPPGSMGASTGSSCRHPGAHRVDEHLLDALDGRALAFGEPLGPVLDLAQPEEHHGRVVCRDPSVQVLPAVRLVARFDAVLRLLRQPRKVERILTLHVWPPPRPERSATAAATRRWCTFRLSSGHRSTSWTVSMPGSRSISMWSIIHSR